MTQSMSLGFPRIGPKRELKRAVERYWRGRNDQPTLLAAAAKLREYAWKLQADAGIDLIPSNDFSLYDQVLDTSMMVGAIPERFRDLGELSPLDVYFAMARGYQGPLGDVQACELTKWFDTNYHYVVPELSAESEFCLNAQKPLAEFAQARDLEIATTPVLVGPLSYLALGKVPGDFDRLDLLERLLPVYEQLLGQLKAAGADAVQLHEPILVTDLAAGMADGFRRAYARLAAAGVDIILATYFGPLAENLELAANLPIAVLHLDLARSPGQLPAAVAAAKGSSVQLSLGLVDGRNVWRTDLEGALEMALQAAAELGSPDRLIVAPSCSLQHCPVDLTGETDLDDELLQWLAFAKQKLSEVVDLARATGGDRASVSDQFERSARAEKAHAQSDRTHDPKVADRLANLTAAMTERHLPYSQRAAIQYEHLGLRQLPTTTIGSFPQSGQVRRQRRAYRRGEQDRSQYEEFLRSEIERTIRAQEELGIDVLVHGEFERTDMVEYFGEQLQGIAFTSNGWVQSYGTRCVRPPLIYGDVSRPKPMTVSWSAFAQSLTKRPVKGMLTAPVTILLWSFVRADQPRAQTCRQIALALRDEVADLEAAGISVIQLDEPALREGLPLRRSEHASYLKWAVECFRLAASGASDRTQIHTHMCYSEFNDIIAAIADLDADVISIEASRSSMELLESFVDFEYPNEIGPGVYDIHSPRIPSAAEMEQRLRLALKHVKLEKLWVNPDCGLKTRRWEEVGPALRNMVEASDRVRQAQPTKQ